MVANVDLSTLTNAELVEGIQRRDCSVTNEFYRRYSYRLRIVVFRQGTPNQDLDDVIHDTIFTAIAQIQAGDLRDARCLGGYLAITAHRKAIELREKTKRLVSLDQEVKGTMNAGLRRSDVMSRADMVLSREPSPEELAILNQQRAVMVEAFRHMKPRDVEILTRFYLKEQTPEEIQSEMGLTETQFRLMKTRAKGTLAKTATRLRHSKELKPYKIAA